MSDADPVAIQRRLSLIRSLTPVQLAELRSREFKALKRRVARLRNRCFPFQTDPYSRHLHLIADALASKSHQYPMLQEEPEHCAHTMYAVLESLWTARLELALSKAK